MAQYATTAQLAQHAMGSVALQGVSEADQNAALEAASRIADGELSREGRYVVPLTVYGSDLSIAVCDIAAYRLLSKKPFAPDGADTVPRKLYNDALARLARWGKGDGNVTGGVTTAAPTVQPIVYTTARRGWSG